MSPPIKRSKCQVCLADPVDCMRAAATEALVLDVPPSFGARPGTCDYRPRGNDRCRACYLEAKARAGVVTQAGSPNLQRSAVARASSTATTPHTKCHNADHITTLPLGVLLIIFNHLDSKTLVFTVPAVCGHFRDACRSAALVNVDVTTFKCFFARPGLTDEKLLAIGRRFRGVRSVSIHGGYIHDSTALLAADRLFGDIKQELPGLRSLRVELCIMALGKFKLDHLASLKHASAITELTCSEPTQWDAPSEDVVTFEFLDEFTALERLFMSHCFQLATLPASIGTLRALTHLDLRYCCGLTSMPDSIGDLAALTSLSLRECESLGSLPESVGRLAALTSLDLSLCLRLVALPESIGKLCALTNLNLRYCKALVALPASVVNLGLTSLNLTSLWSGWRVYDRSVGGRMALRTLPVALGNLVHLTCLELSHCCLLTHVPDSTGNLSALTVLRISHCKLLVSLPDSLGQLTNLASLEVSYCKSLAAISRSIGCLRNLATLNLEQCKSLREVPASIGDLSALVSLNLRGCRSLRALPESIGSLGALVNLDLMHCRSLRVIPESLGNLRALEGLRLGCRATALPASLWSLRTLISLDLGECVSLLAVPEALGNLTNLVSLSLRKCYSLTRLPDSTGDLAALVYLDLAFCDRLVTHNCVL